MRYMLVLLVLSSTNLSAGQPDEQRQVCDYIRELYLDPDTRVQRYVYLLRCTPFVLITT